MYNQQNANMAMPSNQQYYETATPLVEPSLLETFIHQFRNHNDAQEKTIAEITARLNAVIYEGDAPKEEKHPTPTNDIMGQLNYEYARMERNSQCLDAIRRKLFRIL